jgi:hypothetical protein
VRVGSAALPVSMRAAETPRPPRPPAFPPPPQIIKGLKEIYVPALMNGSNVMAIAPLPAPGFVSQ